MPEYRFRLRRRTAASWTSVNEVLLLAEMGLETDTDKFKFGDGSTAWNSLPYVTGDQSGVLLASQLDTDATLVANSDAKVPSQKAVKAYVDQIIAAQDAMVFKGVIDCSANPNYPAADRGWTYRVSVAGKIGGGSGVNVEAGDLLICLTDGTSAGTQAAVGASWGIIQTNTDGQVIGPASATNNGFARFDGVTGKLLKDSPATIGTSDIDADAVTYARMQNVSATDRVLGRSSSGAGDVEEIPFTPVARTLVAQTSQSAMRATGLGLGTAATVDTGTSGATVPLLNGPNTWSSLQVISVGAAGAGGGQSYSNWVPTDYGVGKSRLTLESSAANVWQLYTWDSAVQGGGTFRFGIATVDITGKLQCDALQIDGGGGTAPASDTATGTAGMVRWDANYIYVCTATDTWKRAAIAGGW